MADNFDPMKWITGKFSDWSALHARMDADKELLYIKKYQMQDNYGQPVPNVHNVTLPIPSIFFGRIMALLSSAKQQVEIESESLSDKQKTTIESFLTDLDYEIDTLLANRLIQEMALVQWERICSRGSVGARCCLREDGGTLFPDITPVDARYTVWDVDRGGLTHVATRTSRLRDDIKEEYDYDIKNKEADVYDYWDKKKNIVFINNAPVFEQKNGYGYVPFVISVAPAGSMLQDIDAIKFRGESIFQYIREMAAEANRFGSIVATLTEMSFNNNMQYSSKEGTAASAPEQVELDVSKVFPVDIGGGYKGMPIEDTHRAAERWWNMINEIIQMGSISNINYGTLSFPVSGVAISSLTEAKDKILVPRLQCYAMYKRQLSQMAIQQVIDQRINTELGQSGHKQHYKYTELKGDYSINYKFFSQSKEQEIADSTIANALGNNVSEDYKRKHIFKMEDPDKQARLLTVETLRRTNPLIMKLHQIFDLIDEEDRDLEARIVYDELLTMIQSGQISGNLPEESSGVNKDLIPLMEQGGTGTRPDARPVSVMGG